VLFAEPHRQAVAIWTRGNDLRARIAGEKMDEEPAWMAFAEGKWEPSDAPELSAATMPEVPPATTVTASQPEAAAPPVQVGVEPRATAALVPQNLHAAGNESPIPAAVSPALSASQPATQPEVTATQPAPFSNPGMLPLEESWWTEPGENFTTVWHYLPLTQTNSQRLGFVVPALVFDDAHAAINLQQKKLYILHDGHLIALPIPAAAFGKK
ncbi:MAG TPA: hypothetical protein VHM90_18390, partial [Phycisphaerae bacterium]|nr:hypothetical protein [Phycisphaerae bacterium]